MKQRLLLFVLFAQLLVLTASAYDACIDGIYYNFSDTEATVTYQNSRYINVAPVHTVFWSDYAGDVVIPSSVEYNGDTYPVTSIGGHAFENCSSLTSIEIPSSVTSISSNDTFKGCKLSLVRLRAQIPPNYSVSCQTIEVPYGSACDYANDSNWKDKDIIFSVHDGAKYYPVLIEGDGVLLNGEKREKPEVKEGSLMTFSMAEEINFDENFLYCRWQDVTEEMNQNGEVKREVSPYHRNNHFQRYHNSAEASLDVTLEQSGELINLVDFDKIESVAYLKVTGDLNEMDIAVIKRMVNLQILNLSDANLGDRFEDYFSGNSKLIKVILPKNIKRISNKAFENCSSLLSVKMHEGLEFIGYSAFKNCTSLSMIVLPKGVKSIDFDVFRGCSNLISIDLPTGLTSIGSYAFYGCSSLSSIELPEGLTEIKDYTFDECPNLLSINIPSTVTSVDCKHAFYYKLQSVYISNIDSWLNISWLNTNYSGFYLQQADHFYINGEETVDLNLKIPAYANGMTRPINDYAFVGFKNITSLDTQGNVSEIGKNAFTNCANLKSVILSANVTSIGNGAFSGCDNLTDIYVYHWTPLTITSSVFSGVDKETATLHVPTGRKNYYKIATGWSEFKNIVDDLELQEEPYALLSDDNTILTFYYDNQKMTRGGMDIGPFGRINDQEWKSVEWENAKTLIERVVFDESFAEYKRVTSTAYWFSECENLTTIEGIANLNTSNVTDMSYMFPGCRSLTSLDLSSFNTSNVTNMAGMFEGCSSLTSLDLSGFNTSNVTKMSVMFQSCSSLTNINISTFNTSNVTKMSAMFANCKSLVNLDLSSFNTFYVTDMSYMFSDCRSLKRIYVGEEWSTENVIDSESMFDGCTSLVGDRGTVYDSDYIDATYARIDGGKNNPGYFSVIPSEPEPYVTLSDDNTIMTFYYDKERLGRDGMLIEPFDWYEDRDWNDAASTIERVVFDESFAECKNLTSTAYWFYEFENLTDIEGIENLNTPNVTNMYSMFNGCSSLTSIDVSNFNTSNVTNMSSLFYGCSSLVSLDLSGFNTTNVTSMSRMFHDCSNLTSLDLSNFNTSNVTNMSYLFDGCKSLPSLDLSSFNTEKVTNMSFMFGRCSSLTSLNLSDINTEKVIHMDTMFGGCSSLTSLDLSGFNTEKVPSMGSMFLGCSSLVSLDLSGFNTSNVTNMSDMFHNCLSLTRLDLGSFNTSNVTDMSDMFSVDLIYDGKSSLKSIYVGEGWNTENVIDSDNMFGHCYKLMGGKRTVYDNFYTDATYARIDGGATAPGYFTAKGMLEPYAALSNDNTVLTFYYDRERADRDGINIDPFGWVDERGWNDVDSLIERVVFDETFAEYKEVTSTEYWFYHCKGLKTIEGIENLNISNVTNMRAMFYECSALESLDISSFNTENVTNMSWMFYGCSSLTSLDVRNFNTKNVTNMRAMFYECSALTSLDVSSFNTENVTDMGWMFYGCSSLTNIDVSHFYTENVTNMYSMFCGCSSLTSLDLSSFNTENVTNMNWMFCDCSSLMSLDVSSFNTENVIDMDGMFYGCSSLTSLDVSSFDTKNVVNMKSMFDSCSSLTSLDLSNFDTSNVTDIRWMFYGCSSLTSLDVSSFNTSNVISMYAMFAGCSSLAILDLSGFNTWNVTDMLGLFYGCSALKTIYVGEEWSMANVTSSDIMFDGCTSLVGRKGTVYDSDYTDATYARVDGGESAPGYFTGKGFLEPYIALNDDNTVLTFYYDRKCVERDGMDIESMNAPWAPHYSSLVERVVFDESFAKYKEVTNTNYWFYKFENLKTIDGIENLNTSNVTSMTCMFYGCSSLTSLDVSGFNTEKVTEMICMFYDCSSLANLDVSSFNTLNVFRMSGMFVDCSSLAVLDLSGFNTENVIDMDGMFYGCSSLTSLDVSSFNTSNVTNMASMFYGCSSLTNLDLSIFDTSNAKSMWNMFYNCSSLTSLDLSSFNTSEMLSMKGMFSNCSVLKTIYVGEEWSTGNVIDSESMFEGCTSLVGGKGTVYDSNYTDATYARVDGGETAPGYLTLKVDAYAALSDDHTVLTFYYDSQKNKRGGMDIGPFDSGSATGWSEVTGEIQRVVFDDSFAEYKELTSTAYWFEGCTNLTVIDGIENLNTSNVTNMREMFLNCWSLTNLDVSGLNTSNVTDMTAMFYGCSSFTNIDLNGFNTKNVTDMTALFFECSSLTDLDLSGLNTENVTNMKEMFYGCSSLTSIDLSSFNTKNVTNMRWMFRYCSSLTVLDLSNFNTENVVNMATMFHDCSTLETIYVGEEWSTENVIYSESMFDGCTSLVGGKGTAYDSNHTDATYARIDGGADAPGYFTDYQNSSIINILASGKPFDVYTLGGRKVRHQVTDVDGLPKGVYIMAGQKVVVR